jgi:PEP-CTERM motif
MTKPMFGALVIAGCAFAGSAFAGVPVPVPEPGTLGLLIAGLAAVAAVRLRGRK